MYDTKFARVFTPDMVCASRRAREAARARFIPVLWRSRETMTALPRRAESVMLCSWGGVAAVIISMRG